MCAALNPTLKALISVYTFSRCYLLCSEYCGDKGMTWSFCLTNLDFCFQVPQFSHLRCGENNYLFTLIPYHQPINIHSDTEALVIYVVDPLLCGDVPIPVGSITSPRPVLKDILFVCVSLSPYAHISSYQKTYQLLFFPGQD